MFTGGGTARRIRAVIRSRGRAARFEAIFAVQSGVAAGLAWFLANDVFPHSRPFFAPVAAVIVLSAGVGLRWVRALELAGGVAIGIALGDSVILLIGVGPVQIAAVVALAIMAIAVFGGAGVAVPQAAGTAALVATLAPPTSGIFVERLFDAVLGGAIALLVMVVLPFNPLTRVRRTAGQVLSSLADALTRGARSLETEDPDLADTTLTRLRGQDADQQALRDAVTAGRETATVAPLRWGSRVALARYANASAHIDRATRSVRVMQSRIAALLRDGEPSPDPLAESLAVLATAVRSLRHDLADGRDPAAARATTLDAVRAAGVAGGRGLGMSGLVVVSQVDSAATNLLCAAGLDGREAKSQVRRAGSIGQGLSG
jgi:uncharacterized membrane protein YgaE (UPF0421/DUF939 family)